MKRMIHEADKARWFKEIQKEALAGRARKKKS
jgi:hypothetical protein